MAAQILPSVRIFRQLSERYKLVAARRTAEAHSAPQEQPSKSATADAVGPVPHAMAAQPIQPIVVQALWSSIPPEKEYNIDEGGCCCFNYGCLSGGGTKKLKLYEHDIAWEQTCPNPWPILCLLPTWFWAISCPLYCMLKGQKFVRRKPYTKLTAVSVYDMSDGCCPGCCCSSQISIEGFFGEHPCVPMTHVEQPSKVVNEIASEVEMRIALCRKR